MFKIFQKKKNIFKQSKIVPNFLDSFDGLEFSAQEVKRKLDFEAKRGAKILKSKKNKVVKSYHDLEKAVIKKLNKQHLLFNKALASKEQEIKKIRKSLLSSGKILKVDQNKLDWKDSSWSFSLILVAIILIFKLVGLLPVLQVSAFKDNIIQKSKSAVDSLMGAQKAISGLDLLSAQYHFQSAGSDFLKASEDMAIINDQILSLAALSSNSNIKLAAESKKFLKIGLLGSELGASLSETLAGLTNNNGNWLEIISNFENNGQAVLHQAEALNNELSQINISNLPTEYQNTFSDITYKMDKILENLKLVFDNTKEIKSFLGSGKDKRYLLVFQNNAEMRGAGGFLGSYALVDFREGKIRNLEIPGGGSYDTEAGLKEKVVAPAPLWLVNPRWHFWDANWWPDWPTTAKNLMWFYEKSDGPTVDGVIAFTPSVIEKLLTITGPIDLSEKYGLIINADNFWQEVQLTAERENILTNNPEVVAHLPVGETNKPKKIIGDLTVKILEILPTKLDKDNLVKLLAIFEDSLSAKQVMFYFTDHDLEEAVLLRNWGGKMTQPPFDYLMVANTNIAGAKTDRVIRETIKLNTEISSDGSVINKLKIIREHTGEKPDPLTGVRNVNWLRVYVPLGSELLSADGFSSPSAQYFDVPDDDWQDNEFIAQTEGKALTNANGTTKIYSENNKTVFADWTMIDPGQTAEINLVYKLPFDILARQEKSDFMSRLNKWLNPGKNNFYPYSILFQKQPGAKESKIFYKLILPLNLKSIWNSFDSQKSENYFYLKSDSFYSWLLSNNN